MKSNLQNSAKRRSLTFKSVLIVAFALVWTMNVQAQNVQWKNNLGGSSLDIYSAVATLPDGTVAVGVSGSASFGSGDWESITGKGSNDATIVKYDNTGNVVWKKNFGGIGSDRFIAVTTVSDGIVAVGESQHSSFGTGDWEGIPSKLGIGDAIIVKYDFDGNVLWKKNFGGGGWDEFYAVTAVSDGVVAVGVSQKESFNSAGDWADENNNVGYTDAIIVKYSNDGNVVWKKHFGGFGDGGTYISGGDDYYAVTAVSDGIVAVGFSRDDSFGTGDWFGIAGNGNDDAIIVKYDNNGNVVWKKNLGGIGIDDYDAVTAVSDGIVAAGHSAIPVEGGTGDWEGVAGNGDIDAIIVKYDYNGNVVSKKHFGGNGNDEGYFGNDYYNAVTVVSDGIVTVGESPNVSFGSGDWEGIAGKGYNDATIVKYLVGSSISGYVTESGGGKSISSKSGDNPVEGVDVLLQKYTSVWNTISSTVSDEEGYFEFLGISAGTYRVVLDISGLEMLSYRVIEITEDDTIIDDLEFEITDNGIITIGSEVSIKDIINSSFLHIYPNPAQDELYIESGDLKIESIEISNITGKTVQQINGLQKQINVSALSQGIYFVKIETDKEIVTKKFIKE